MILLAISTSGPVASAALLQDGVLLRKAEGPRERTHSETIMGLIQQAYGDLEPYGIDALAVDVGPGSFTGVRIGVCVANAMAKAWQKPVIPVSSLAALSHGLAGYVCALLDCRNGNGYAMITEQGNLLLPESPVVVEELLRQLPPGACIVGDGAAVYQAAIQEAVPGAVLLGDRIVTGEAVGACAFSGTGVAEVMPLYLRPAQAERLYKEQHP